MRFYTDAMYDYSTPKQLEQQPPGKIMKIVYSREEVIEIMKTTVSELIDVDIEEIEFSNYGVEFLHITCTKVKKVTVPSE